MVPREIGRQLRRNSKASNLPVLSGIMGRHVDEEDALLIARILEVRPVLEQISGNPAALEEIRARFSAKPKLPVMRGAIALVTAIILSLVLHSLPVVGGLVVLAVWLSFVGYEGRLLYRFYRRIRGGQSTRQIVWARMATSSVQPVDGDVPRGDGFCGNCGQPVNSAEGPYCGNCGRQHGVTTQ